MATKKSKSGKLKGKAAKRSNAAFKGALARKAKKAAGIPTSDTGA